MARYEQQRNFLKSNFHEFKKIKTDKIKRIPKPAIVKLYYLYGVQSPTVQNGNMM